MSRKTPTTTTLLLLLSLLALAQARYRSTRQFQDWYPEYAAIFTRIRDENCSVEFQNYLAGTSDRTVAQVEHEGGSAHTLLVHPVMLCMLDHTNEYVKAAMSSAQVILGFTPTILGLVGPSSEEFAALSVVGGRPLLAALLAVAAPSVFATRAFEPVEPRDVLAARPGGYFSACRARWQRAAVVLAEYLLALAALANVGLVSYDAGVRTANPIAGNFVFFPAVWAAGAAVIHAVAVVLVRLKTPFVERGSLGFWARELSLSHRPPPAVVGWAGKESKRFVFGAWVHSIFIVGHLLFGTVVFSSLQFVGQSDAISVLGRYVASVIVCRMILMYELAFLKKEYRDLGVVEKDERGKHMPVQLSLLGAGSRYRVLGDDNPVV